MISHDTTVWTKENYKIAFKTINTIPTKELRKMEIGVSKGVKRLQGIENLSEFLSKIQTKEFKLLPFRVSGDEDDAKARQFIQNDVFANSFTIYSKLSFATLSIFEMVDTQVQEEPFVQVIIERFYSKKKGYGYKLIKHLVTCANRYKVTLTVWCENEKLRDYFVNHGFVEQYKSIKTGHYFLKLN